MKKLYCFHGQDTFVEDQKPSLFAQTFFKAETHIRTYDFTALPSFTQASFGAHLTAGYISTFMRKGFSFPMGMLLKRFEAGAVSSEGHYGGNGAFRAKA